MVYRLRPLKVRLDFEGRAYRLGETIRLRVGLEPGSDVDVREGRVDLVCEERWSQVYSATGYSRRLAGTSPVPKQTMKKHREKFVHSNVVFLQDTRLQAGSPSSHDVRFQIQPEPPPHTGPQREEAAVRWWLVATVDIVRGRNPRTQWAVKILNPPPGRSTEACSGSQPPKTDETLTLTPWGQGSMGS